MNRQTILVTLCLCATLIACSAFLSRAGNLEPPEGPIQPSMATLEQLDLKLNGLLAQADPIDEGWSWIRVSGADLPVVEWTEVINGSGVLNTIIAWRGQGFVFDLRDSNGQVMFSDIGDTQMRNRVFHDLNLRFSDGIEIFNNAAGDDSFTVTLLYRLDPPFPVSKAGAGR